MAVATEAVRAGLTPPIADNDIAAAVKSLMWEPVYATYRRLVPR